jgi:hypothetical protein
VTLPNTDAITGSKTASTAADAATESVNVGLVRCATRDFEQCDRSAEGEEEPGVAHLERPRTHDQRRRDRGRLPRRGPMVAGARREMRAGDERRSPH